MSTFDPAAPGRESQTEENLSAPRRKQGPAFIVTLVVPVRALFTAVVLVIILGVGAALRLTGVDWDSGQHLHPDERFITMVETSIRPVHSLEEYFDTARSSLNPYNVRDAQGNRTFPSFVYGTLPLFLVRYLGELLGKVDYGSIHLVGRVASATVDLGTVLLIFLVGRSLYGTAAGLLAAFLTAVNVLHIQQSHFFTTDTFVVFTSVLAFLFAARVAAGGGWASYLLAGAAFGVAVGSKINAALFVVVLALACYLRWRRIQGHETLSRVAPGTHDGVEPSGKRGALVASGPASWEGPAAGFLAALLAAILTFRVVQPYAFAGPSVLDMGLNLHWLGDLENWRRISSGEIDYPPSHQWTSTPAYLFPLQHMVLWGMSPLVGVLAWLGFLFAAWQVLARRPGWERHALVVVWVAVNFLYWGGAFAKTMRYFLPIYPLLLLLAANLLVEMWRYAGRGGLPENSAFGWANTWIRRRLAGWQVRAAIMALGVATGALALLYALAFVSIYTRPVTRVAASQWIYENIPAGTVVANEHWDDPLPLYLPGRNAAQYQGLMLTLYDDDTPAKLQQLEATLQRAEYIFITSNRLYGSIPRLPMRYPMTTAYYRYLFSGDLGFDLVKTFESHPTLLGLVIDDSHAEEAFTVYDHPNVLIFKKREDFSVSRVHELLAPYLDGEILRLKPVQVPRNGLLLGPGELEAARQGGTWSELFHRDDLVNQVPVLVWLLTVQALAMTAVPVSWMVFRRLADRGYLASKTLALLVVAYVPWLLASLRLLPFGRASILLAWLGLLIVSAAIVYRHGPTIGRDLMSGSRAILAGEAVFLAAFSLFLAIRAFNPDLWHPNFGGEKPMNFAYLNAIVKSDYFPPYDPWFAGGYINYYYFGYVLVAAVIKLTGVVPAVAYNLAIPLLFALLATNSFAFGYNLWRGRRPDLTRRGTKKAIVAGVLSAVFVGLVGNLDGAVQIVEALGAAGGLQVSSGMPWLASLVRAAYGIAAVLGGARLPFKFDFWRSTRVIGPEDPGPISEFPFFTFLYGDLHAHMMAMPLTVLALLVGLNAIWGRPGWEPDGDRPDQGTWVGRYVLAERSVGLVVAGLVIGALRPTNTWDFPTYLGVLAVAFAIPRFVRDRSVSVRLVGELVLAGGAIFVLASIFFYPYLQRYELFYVGVDPVKARTSLQHFLTIHGFFFFVLGAFAVLVMVRRAAARLVPAEGSYLAVMAAPIPFLVGSQPVFIAGGVALIGAAALAYLSGQQVPALLLLGMAFAAWLADRFSRSPERLYLVSMTATSLAVTLLPELVALKGDIGRMNTVFKFYIQAWVLLGLTTGVCCTYMLTWANRPDSPWPGWRRAFLTCLGVLLASIMVYPLLGTPAKVGLRFASLPPTLDGMAYMPYARYEDRGRDMQIGADYTAIRWLQDHVRGSPVVLEGNAPLYHWGSRVSIYTGLPTIIGWDWHQKQQRGDFAPMVDARVQDVRRIYDDVSTDAAMGLLNKYGVTYIYVGELERAFYSPQGLAKFEAMVGNQLCRAYQDRYVTIYRVAGAGQRPNGPDCQ